MAQGDDTSVSKTGAAGGGAAAGKSGSGSYAEKASALGHEAASQIGDVADQARRSATRTAKSLVHDAEERVESLADRQLSYGADLVGKFAEALRAASDVLEDDLPPAASLGYSAADQIDDFADSVRARSAGDLLGTVTEVARRRPAILLGAAAAAGFIIYRAANASAKAASASPEPASAPGTRQPAARQAAPRQPANRQPANRQPAAKPATASTPAPSSRQGPAAPSSPAASPSTPPVKPSTPGGRDGA